MEPNLENKTEEQKFEAGTNEVQPPSSILKNILVFVGEIAEIIVISLAIIIPIRYFLVQPFYVKGASMEPNFYDGEYLIIDELNYRLREPERGEVIVFKYPFDTRQYFIKRVIGLPGEEISIGNGKITVFNSENPKGIYVDETNYMDDGILTFGETKITLNADEYFVLGDNRNASLDSRTFGPLKKDLIIGRVWLRGWPLERVGSVEKPVYAGLEL
jgi:signal peptidase I